MIILKYKKPNLIQTKIKKWKRGKINIIIIMAIIKINK